MEVQAIVSPEQTETSTTVEKEDVSSDKTKDEFGGDIEKPAYCLITGKYEDLKLQTEPKTIVVPITTLPAILGRTQNTTDEHIFDLGDCKQISRKHAKIFFSNPDGGDLGRWKESEKGEHVVDSEWRYRKSSGKSTKKWIKKKGCSLPEKGFFVIECLSKNKLYVDGLKVLQGETAVLRQGSRIKMLTYTLYFLLPESDEKKKVISIPSDKVDASTEPPQKKIKKEKEDSKLEEESMSLDQMIKEFLHAVSSDTFERRHSIISTGILQHAVDDCANDGKMQALSMKEEGVSRSVIMDWIAANSVYSEYIKALLTKLEMKSYQQNLSKALKHCEYERIGTTGRHVKWKLPERDVEIPDLDDVESLSETKATNNSDNLENRTTVPSEAKEEVEKEFPNEETTKELSRELDGKTECTQETVKASASTENSNEEKETTAEQEDSLVRIDSNLNTMTTTDEETKEQNNPMQETTQ